MAGEKISGKLTGNKLNITISTNSGTESKKGLAPIEASGNKVKSISELNAQENSKKSDLNKRQVKEEKKESTNNLKELEALQNIIKKLDDLNNNIIKIQTLRNNESKVNQNVKEEKKNIFDAKFIEGNNKSFIELLKNTTFKTNLKTFLNDVYDSSSLLKSDDFETFKSEIKDLISSSQYTIPNSEKAVNQEKQIDNTNETVKVINQEVKEGNEAIDSGSVVAMEQVGEAVKVFTEKVETSNTLNTNTSDEQQNQINEMLKEIAANQSSSENNTRDEAKKDIDKKAVENDNIEDKKEVNELNVQSEQKLAEVENIEKGRPESEDDEANKQLVEKLDEVKDDLIEHKESVDSLIEEIKLNNESRIAEREERKTMHDEKKAMLDEKKKMMAEKANKSSSIFGTIKNSFSNATASIKNIGKSLAISKPISRFRNLFNKEQNKDFTPKKVNTLKIVDQKQTPEKDNTLKTVDQKQTPEKDNTIVNQPKENIVKINFDKKDLFDDKEKNKTTPITVGKNQQTISGKDSLTPLREVGKNSEQFLMNQGMKKVGSLNNNKDRGPLKELIKISTLLSGFLMFYKKFAKDAEARELYKLRFGSEKKTENNSWQKFLNFFKPKKGKPKEKAQSGDNSLGILGSIIGVIFVGLKFFGKQIGKLVLKGLWALTKLIGKGLWKLTVWVGKLAWKGISWVIGKLGSLIGKLFKFLWGKISGIIGKVFGKIGNILGKVSGKVIGAFKNVFGKIFGKASQLIGKIFGKLGGVFGKVFNGIFGKLGGIFNKFGGLFGKLGGAVSKVAGKIGQAAGKIGKAAQGIAKGAGKAAKGIAKGAGKLIKGAGKGIKSAGSFIGKAGKGIKSAGSFIGKVGKGMAKPLTKMFSKGGGKVVAKLATKGLAKAGLKVGLRAGAHALKAIPGLGLIATAGMAAFDAVDGWRNAASITGKKEKDLTWKDKTKAAGASVLSGLTFGLVSSQTMYKGINAVGDFAKKAWKYTPMGLAASGAKKAWNWLTKPSKTVDPKTGKVVAGKTGLQKIGDAGKAGLKAIGNIGKTLFKFTPMGMAMTAVKGVSNLLKPKQTTMTFDQKQFAELKSLISGVKGTTALAAKKSDVSKFIGPLKKINELSTKGIGSVVSKMSKPIKSTIDIVSMHPLIKASTIALRKMGVIENNKVAAMKKSEEIKKSKSDLANKKFDAMPQIITMGIAAYFDKHTLKVDQKTGKIEVLPLGRPDVAKKV